MIEYDLPPPNPAVEAIALRLREFILDGTLRPGDDISQVKLAVEFGVSRTPLREAMRMLEHEGLIEATPNRQSRIRRISPADLDQLYGERIAIESLAALTSVPLLTTEDLDRMRSSISDMDRVSKTEEPAAWDVPHAEFHRIVLSRSGHRVLGRATELRDHARRYRLQFLRGGQSPALGVDEHRELLAACDRSNAATASLVLARHLARTALGLMTEIAPQYDPVTIRSALRMVECSTGPARGN